MFRRVVLALVGAFFVSTSSWAQNGHLLLGVGAVNSSMGGAGTAVPIEVIGALHLNPALLVDLVGENQVGFSVNLFKDSPQATATFSGSRVGAPPDGAYLTSGSTEPGVIPAIGFSYHPKDSNWAVGFGLLGVAGFRTDWPQDPNNPVFRPQPDGFGSVKTNLAISKIPIALAYRVMPNMSVGVSVNVYQGGLSISPLPPAAPDCTRPRPGSGRAVDCVFADANNVVSAYAVGVQAGVHYQMNQVWSIGVSYTSTQNFDDYVWNSQVALSFLRNAAGTVTPNPDLGKARTVRYPLDGPQIVSAGLGMRANPKLKLGVDGRWVKYDTVDGAGGVGGFKPDHSLNDIGWRNIWVGAIGAEYQSSDHLSLRAGFNYGQTPIREEVAFSSLGTPPTFQDNYTFGLGWKATDKLEFNVGAYYSPRRDVTGPLLSPFLVDSPQTLEQQRVPGGTFTISEKLISGLVALNYRF